MRHFLSLVFYISIAQTAMAASINGPIGELTLQDIYIDAYSDGAGSASFDPVSGEIRAYADPTREANAHFRYSSAGDILVSLSLQNTGASSITFGAGDLSYSADVSVSGDYTNSYWYASGGMS